MGEFEDHFPPYTHFGKLILFEYVIIHVTKEITICKYAEQYSALIYATNSMNE